MTTRYISTSIWKYTSCSAAVVFDLLQTVALKLIPKVGKGKEELKALDREISIMRELHHDNIISLYDCIETRDEVCT